MPCDTLRDQLIGAWSLQTYALVGQQRGDEMHPLGHNPAGLLIYTSDGFMSATLQTRSRAPFASHDMYGGTETEYSEAGRTYLSYAGMFSVDEDTSRVTHHMTLSYFPNWTGQSQVRLVECRGDVLLLATDKPVLGGGGLRTAQLSWRRVHSNIVNW